MLAERMPELAPRTLLQLALVLLAQEYRELLEILYCPDLSRLDAQIVKFGAVVVRAVVAVLDGRANAFVTNPREVGRGWEYGGLGSWFYQTFGSLAVKL
jgi:hypothetical protein